MGRNKEIIKPLMIFVTLCHLVCQIGVKGNTLGAGKSEGNNNKEDTIYLKENEIEQGNGNEDLSDVLNSNESPTLNKFEVLDKLIEENEKKAKSTDDSVKMNVDTSDITITNLDPDSTTIYKRVQEMPLKLGLQFLTAKYGISGSLDKARQGGTHIYDGTKDAVETITDFVSEGIGNARFLLFGTK